MNLLLVLIPAERNRFLNILREIGTQNTVIFSTHIVEDVIDLCTDLAIMNHGRVLQHEAPLLAIKNIANKIWIKVINRSELEQEEKKYTVLSSSYNPDNSINIRVFSEHQPSPEFSAAKPGLEDVYFIALQSKKQVA